MPGAQVGQHGGNLGQMFRRYRRFCGQPSEGAGHIGDLIVGPVEIGDRGNIGTAAPFSQPELIFADAARCGIVPAEDEHVVRARREGRAAAQHELGEERAPLHDALIVVSA